MTGLQKAGHSPEPARSGWRTVVVVGVGLLSVALVARETARRNILSRPRDSAPASLRKMGLGDGSLAESCVTLAAPVADVTVTADRQGVEALVSGGRVVLSAQELGGEDAGRFDLVQHQIEEGATQLSWRGETGGPHIALTFRPVRGGRMTAVQASLSHHPRVDAGAQTRLHRALTRFRMQCETGELARAR